MDLFSFPTETLTQNLKNIVSYLTKAIPLTKIIFNKLSMFSRLDWLQFLYCVLLFEEERVE